MAARSLSSSVRPFPLLRVDGCYRVDRGQQQGLLRPPRSHKQAGRRRPSCVDFSELRDPGPCHFAASFCLRVGSSAELSEQCVHISDSHRDARTSSDRHTAQGIDLNRVTVSASPNLSDSCERSPKELLTRKQAVFLRKLAPQAGLEPATLRLTEATPVIDRMRPLATKMMRSNDFPVSGGPTSTSVDRRN